MNTATAQVKERGLICTGESVRAILDDRKTMMRRVVKLPRPMEKPHLYFNVSDEWTVYDDATTPKSDWHSIACPYGKPGDRLFVRETWLQWDWEDLGTEPQSADTLRFRADGDIPAVKWRPSIFMPRWASRITLEITNVRVERLQDISEEDAKAEGVPIDDSPCDHARQRCEDIGCLGPGYRSSFCDRWEDINGKKYPWSSNPWVWCISFRRIEA